MIVMAEGACSLPPLSLPLQFSPLPTWPPTQVPGGADTAMLLHRGRQGRFVLTQHETSQD